MTVTQQNEWVPSIQCLESTLQSTPEGLISYFPSSQKLFFLCPGSLLVTL